MADGEGLRLVEGEVLPPLTDVVLQPSPFVAPRTLHIGPGATVEDIVRHAGISPALAAHVQVFIGEHEIEHDVWHLVKPKLGAVVNVRVQLHGGSGGKDTLRAIAMIAVMVIAMTFAGPMVGSILGATGLAAVGVSTTVMTALTAVAQVAIMTAGMMLVNALIPPPGAKNQWGFDQELGNPYGSITGLRNQMVPYGPIPRVLGKRRMFPMLAGRPYTETFGNDQYLRLLLLVGMGPVAISEIKLGETPISAYPGIEIETREGWESDTPVTLYQKAIKEDQYAVVLDAAGSTTTKTTRINTKEISIEIGFPSGVNRVDKGELRYHEVSFTVQYRVAGSGGAWINADWLEPNAEYGTATDGVLFVRDKTQAGLRRSGRWTVAPGQYEVKITRTSPIEPMGEMGYAIFTTLRSIVDEDFLPVAGMSLIALRMKASGQLNGVPDQINCVAESYLPVYDPGTETWDYEITRNPAWAFADLLRRRCTETVNTDDRIDLETIVDWAAECDSTPPNGAAPYWTFDGVVEGGSIFTALRTVASHGRASFTIRDGKYSVVRDQTQTVPVQHISPRNSWGYSGSKVFAEIPHALRIRFSNEEKLYAEDEVVVYQPGYSVDGAGATEPATTFETLDMPGISRSSQAWREGMYHFAVLRLRTETHNVSMDVENLRCTLGSLVLFSHDAIKVGLAHGRVTGVTISGPNITHITLDGEVQCDPGVLLGVRCRKADFATAALHVVNPATSSPVMTDTLQLVTPVAIASGPEVEDLFQFGERGLETAPMIVKRIAPGPDLTATVTMTNADAGIWTADQGTIPAFNSYITTPQPFERAQPPVPVMRLSSDSNTARYTADSTVIERIAVSFEAWPSAEIPIEAVEVQYRDLESPDFTPLPRQPRDTAGCYIDPVYAGAEYEVRARTISPYGLTSEWAVAQIEAAGKTTAPDPVTSLTASNGVGAQVGKITLNWGLPTDIDLWAVEIWSATTNDRALAAKVDAIADPGITYDHALAGTVNRYYWARCVDLSGNISTWFPAGATSGVLGQTRAVIGGDLDTTPPGTPGTPTLSQTSVINTDGTTVTNMKADWADNAESDLNGYLVEWLEAGVSLGRAPVAISQDTIRVKTGVSYEARVWAIDKLGNVSGSYSTASLTAGGDTTAPAVPTSPIVTPLARRNLISWAVPADDDYSHLKLYRRTNGTTPSGEGDLYNAQVEGSSFTDTNVTAGVTYHYWGKSVDRTGNVGTITLLGSGTPSYISVGGGDVSSADAVLVTELGSSADVLRSAPVRLAAIDAQANQVLQQFEASVAEQARRHEAGVATQALINHIGVVDPISGVVVMGGDNIQIGAETLGSAVNRVDRGLGAEGEIQVPVPREVAESSGIHNEQIQITAWGELVINNPEGTVSGGQILRVAEATQNLGHDSVIRRSALDANLGGRYFLQKPLINTTLAGDLAFDIYQSSLRIFDASTLSGVSLPFSAFQATIGGRLVVSTAAGVVTGDVASTTALRAPLARIGNDPGDGYVTLVEGDATYSGRAEFYNGAGTRLGYVGFGTGSTLVLAAEGAFTWAFDKQVRMLAGAAVTGALSVTTGDFRFTGGGTYAEPAANTGVLSYDSVGGALTLSARSNGGSTYISFRTSNAGVGSEHLRILADGNTSVGHTTTTYDSHTGKLGVLATKSSNAVNLILTDAAAQAAGVGGVIGFTGKYNDAGAYAQGARIGAQKVNSTTGDYGFDLAFWTRPNGGSLAQRMLLTSTGRLGIGTTAPSNQLHVSDNSSGNQGVFQYGAGGRLLAFGADGTAGRIQAYTAGFAGGAPLNLQPDSGNVGVGTSAPETRLHVTGSVRSRTTGAGYIDMVPGDATNTGRLEFRNAADLRYGYIGLVNTTARVIDFRAENAAVFAFSGGNVGIGTAAPGALLHVLGGNARVQATSDGSNGVIQVYDTAASTLLQIYNDSTKGNIAVVEAKPLLFYTTNLERLRIAAGGNVGIGTSSPSTKLEVNGNIRTTPGSAGIITLFDNDAVRMNQLLVGADANGSYIHSSYASGGTGDLRLISANTERVRIKEGGNVGVGTSAPETRLHVAGDIRARNGAVGYVDLLSGDATNTGRLEFRNASSTRYGYIGLVNDTAKVIDFRAENSAVFAFSGGNVGIGTTTPSIALQVESSTNGSNGFFVRNTNAGSSASCIISANSDSASVTLAAHSAASTAWPDAATLTSGPTASGGLQITTATTAPIGFWTNSTERMRIASGGNVGIGTAAPLAKLDICSGASSQFTPTLALRGMSGGNSNALEWGHTNAAGYGSTLGHLSSAGNPYIAFNGEAGTAINTFRTRGIRSSIIISDLLGGLQFGNVATAAATDDQAFVQTARISSAGLLTLADGLVAGGSLTITGNVDATGRVRSRNGAVGYVDLLSGDATNTGRLEFRNAAATRYGYIGLVNDTAKVIDFRAENSAVFQFTGGLVTMANGATVTGTLRTGAILANGATGADSLYEFAGGNILLDNAYSLRSKSVAGVGFSLLSVTTGNNVQINAPAVSGAIQLSAPSASGVIQFLNGGVERLRISADGNVGIGDVTTGPPVIGTTLRIGKNLTGATNAQGAYNNQVVQSDVTSTAQLFSTFGSTAAATFTLGSLVHYSASQNAIGAGSTVTNQIGFHAQSTLIGATNNYGFYGAIAAGTGRYNFYALGTAPNYFEGNTGIGITVPLAKLDVKGSIRTSVGSGGTLTLYDNDAVRNNRLIAGADASGAYFDTTFSTGGTAALLFRTTGTEHMRVLQSGNIAVGSTVATYDGLTSKFSVLSAKSGNTAGQMALVDSTAQAAGVGGSLAFTGKYNDAGAYADGARIAAQKVNSTTGDYGFDLAFWTRTNGASLTQKMVLTSTGRLGIGTTAPDYQLHVRRDANDTQATLGLTNTNAGSGARVALRFINDAAGEAFIGLNSSGTSGGIGFPDTLLAQTDKAAGIAYVSSHASGIFRVFTGGTSAGSERLRVTATGDVGIGTTSPAAKLHVSGGGVVMNTTGGASTSVGRHINLGSVASPTDWRAYSGNTTAALQMENSATEGFVLAATQGAAVPRTQLITTGGFQLNVGATIGGAGTNALQILNTGNVGLGTATPGSLLHLLGANPRLTIESNGAGGPAMVIAAENTAGTVAPNRFFIGQGSTPYLTISTVSSGGAGNVGIGTTAPGRKLDVFGSSIAIRADGDGSNRIIVQSTAGDAAYNLIATGAGGRTWTLQTGDTSSALSGRFRISDSTAGLERLAIDTAGNVGINTAAPSKKLDVVAADGDGLQFRTSTRTVGLGQISGEAAVYWGSGTRLDFATGGTVPLSIASGGNVGVGTTAPDTKLHVAGAIKLAGSLVRTGADQTFAVDTGQGFRWAVNGTDVALLEASGTLSLNAVNMGGFGIGVWADWSPTPSTGSGAATGLAMAYAERERQGKSVTINFAVSQTAIGTAGTSVIVPLPFAAKASRSYFGMGKNFNTGADLRVEAIGSNLVITAANSYPMGSGAESLAGSITYQCA